MKTKYLVQGAIIASHYIVLTYVTNLFGLASGAIQVRISEALTVLPYFTPAAIPGIFVGVFLANLLTGSILTDVIVGSLLSLGATLTTYVLRKKSSYLAPVPPILFNAIGIPFVLRYAYGIPGSLAYFGLTVGIGQIISAGILGLLLLNALKKKNINFN